MFHGLLNDFLYLKGCSLVDLDRTLVNKYGDEFNNAVLKFINLFDDSFFPLSKKSNVIEIEKELATLGIDARCCDDFETANKLLNACKKMKEKGIEKFPQYRINPDKSRSAGIGIPAANRIEDGYVYIQNLFKDRSHASVNTPEGFIWHETAHALNKNLKLSESLPCFSSSDKLFEEYSEILSSEVSSYSNWNRNEACSEIFAGLLDGKTYSSWVIDFLELCNGIRPHIN